MKDTAYLVVTARGIKSVVRKQRPKLGKGEYAVHIELIIPDYVFAERPFAQASLQVNAAQLQAPPVEVTQIDPAPEPVSPPPLESDPDYKAGLSEG